MSDPVPPPPSFPHYTAPQGIPVCHPKQQSILTKVIGRMMTSGKSPRSKGLVSRQSVKIKHKKVKFW